VVSCGSQAADNRRRQRRQLHPKELSPIFGDGLIDQAAAVAD
jgi:hypothetical protein